MRAASQPSFVVDAISHDDINLIMGTVLVSAVFVVLANILVDVAQTWLDPRVRLDG